MNNWGNMVVPAACYLMLLALGWAFGAAAVANFVVAVSMCVVAVACGAVVLMLDRPRE